MGACDISFSLDGKKTFSQVEQAFKDQQRQDASENGHRDGYSGDFQTVHKVEDHSYKTDIFSDRQEAMEYCLKNADKWTSVVAVKYKKVGEIKDAKLTKLQKRFSDAQKARREAGEKVAKAILEAKSTLVGCKDCGSKIARKRLKSVKCPVCNTRLVAPSAEKRLAKLDAKVEAIGKLIDARHDELIKKAKGEVRWLIAGWGAC